VRHELWTTEDPARLPELDDRLDGVEDEIAALWARPPKLRLQSTGFAPSLDGVTVVRPASAPDPVAVERHDVHVARLLEGVVVLVAGLVAMVTALGTLYVGKPFGTVWDYLALATWALATPVAVAALGAALDNLGALEALQRRISAR